MNRRAAIIIFAWRLRPRTATPCTRSPVGTLRNRTCARLAAAGRQTHRLDLRRAEFSAAAVAFSLDKMLNNTSIVALFTFAGKHMLFPGDAQYGDWAYWYKKTGAEVLSDICFYKVAHHGSMNATPRRAGGNAFGQVAAMASTRASPFLPFLSRT